MVSKDNMPKTQYFTLHPNRTGLRFGTGSARPRRTIEEVVATAALKSEIARRAHQDDQIEDVLRLERLKKWSEPPR